MRYRVRRPLDYMLNGQSREHVTVSAGTEVDPVRIEDLDPFHRAGLRRQVHQAGMKDERIVVFVWEDVPRAATIGRDVEPIEQERLPYSDRWQR